MGRRGNGAEKKPGLELLRIQVSEAPPLEGVTGLPLLGSLVREGYLDGSGQGSRPIAGCLFVYGEL